jgi:Skp family chaperone for outer membrane proteins
MKKLFLLLLLSSNVFAIKIGYINIDLLLSESKQFNESQKEIAAEFKAKDKKLKVKSDSLNLLIAEFKENQEDLTDKEKSSQVSKIKKLDLSLQKAVKKVKEQFNLRNTEELQKIQDTINKIINKFAKSNNFDLVLYKDIAYVSEKIDITSKIAKKLSGK